MTWQDVVLGMGQIVLLVALFPSVFSKDKPAFSTSLLTGSTLLIFAFVFSSLSLWLSAMPTVLTGLTWFILAYQKIKSSNK